MKIINVTTHPLVFSINEQDYAVPPCGVVITVEVISEPFRNLTDIADLPGLSEDEKAYMQVFGTELVKVSYRFNSETEKALTKLESENPGAIIVGSMIAAQAFPGRVYCAVTLPGYERVKPELKRLDPCRFTGF